MIYIPIYNRRPNKLLRYVERRFDYGYSQVGTERIAIFVDKKGKEHEMIAQILWDEKV